MKSAEYTLCVCGVVQECSLCVEQCVCVCVCVRVHVNRYEWAAIQATLHTCQVHPVLVMTTHNMDTHTHTHTHTHTPSLLSNDTTLCTGGRFSGK